MAPATAAVKALSSARAGPGNAARFPRPFATVPRRPAGPGQTKGQRPAQRGRSARRGRGGRWPGALGPRLVLIRCSAVAGAMAPAIAAVMVPSPVRAGTGNAARFPCPRGTVPCRPAGPGRTEARARPGGREAPAEGGAGAGRGGFGPPTGPDPGAALWRGRWPLPLKRGRGCHQFRREQEPRPAFPPPLHDGTLQTGRSGNTGRPAPTGGGEAPGPAQRAPAGGFCPGRARWLPVAARPG